MDMLMESAPLLVALGLVLLLVCMRPSMLQSKTAQAEQPLCCMRMAVAVLLIAVVVIGGQYMMSGNQLRF